MPAFNIQTLSEDRAGFGEPRQYANAKIVHAVTAYAMICNPVGRSM